jgi:hypothetical protein
MSVRVQSSHRLFGIPLYDIAIGPDPARGEAKGRAKGIIAVGDVASGLVAVGGVAVGGIALGGVSAGIVSVGGCCLGLLARGGVAVGAAAWGGLAVGLWGKRQSRRISGPRRRLSQVVKC